MRTSRLLFPIALFTVTAAAFAGQPLETETARPLPQGIFKVEFTAEFQHSKEGTERAFPFLVEYGITDRTELTVEPVFGVAIRPKNGTPATGVGDIEVTLTHLLKPELGAMPAFAVAGEVKIPTARNTAIGTGKTDFAVFGIASKKFDRLDLHANLGYTVVGKPAGLDVKNLINYAVAEEFHLTPKFDIVAEVVGTTSAGSDKAEGTPTVPGNVSPEVGGESSALVGFRYRPSPAFYFSLGISYDRNHAILYRPGFTYRFGGK
jgi:Putative MetA-pathway of phenol degradation